MVFIIFILENFYKLRNFRMSENCRLTYLFEYNIIKILK